LGLGREEKGVMEGSRKGRKGEGTLHPTPIRPYLKSKVGAYGNRYVSSSSSSVYLLRNTIHARY